MLNSAGGGAARGIARRSHDFIMFPRGEWNGPHDTQLGQSRAVVPREFTVPAGPAPHEPGKTVPDDEWG